MKFSDRTDIPPFFFFLPYHIPCNLRHVFLSCLCKLRGTQVPNVCAIFQTHVHLICIETYVHIFRPLDIEEPNWKIIQKKGTLRILPFPPCTRISRIFYHNCTLYCTGRALFRKASFKIYHRTKLGHIS